MTLAAGFSEVGVEFAVVRAARAWRSRHVAAARRDAAPLVARLGGTRTPTIVDLQVGILTIDC